MIEYYYARNPFLQKGVSRALPQKLSYKNIFVGYALFLGEAVPIFGSRTPDLFREKGSSYPFQKKLYINGQGEFKTVYKNPTVKAVYPYGVPPYTVGFLCLLYFKISFYVFVKIRLT